ncbi:hypothetical protein JW766_05180 [Candidatus Dojkabacteria bacterium]|nr:hypothetical protein [Candidatus Dojkabacteria bacterium]
MNPIIQTLVETKGVPETSIILLLTLPIIATIIAIWRQIVGLRTFGIYAPILITFAFYQFGITPDGINVGQGLKYGLALSIVVFVSATLAHEMTRKIRLHYLPKMSIVLSIVAMAVFIFIGLAAGLDKGGFISVDTLPVLLLITVSEQMISLYIKKGRKAAYFLTVGTLVISVLSYYLISWKWVHETLLKYPLISPATLLVNLIIGKWTGFRFKEYFRFKNILVSSESD